MKNLSEHEVYTEFGLLRLSNCTLCITVLKEIAALANLPIPIASMQEVRADVLEYAVARVS